MNNTKICKKCGIEQSLDCFYANLKCRDGHANECKACKAERSKKNYVNNKEKYKKQWQAWASKNDRTDYFYNYRLKNKERISKYLQDNPHIGASKTARRRARLALRTPKWLDVVDLFEIECIYKYCSSLRKVGLKYEVDHKEPLFGKNVSGLHVPSNLRVITEHENRTKSNKSLYKQ